MSSADKHILQDIVYSGGDLHSSWLVHYYKVQAIMDNTALHRQAQSDCGIFAFPELMILLATAISTTFWCTSLQSKGKNAFASGAARMLHYSLLRNCM